MPTIHSRSIAFVLLTVASFALALSASASNDWRNLVFMQAISDGDGGLVDGLSGARSVAVSPDGKHVYVVGYDDNAVVALARDPIGGELTFLEVEQDEVGSVHGMLGPRFVTVSPDGKHVYIAGALDNSVVVFLRDATTGGLDWEQMQEDGEGIVDNLTSPNSIASSPDGKHVYVTSLGDDAVAWFGRNLSNGHLLYIAAVKNSDPGVDGLTFPTSVAVSPDGEHVYVTGGDDDSVVVLDRDPTSGTLTFIGRVQDDFESVDGLNGPLSVTVSPDGKHVYVAASLEDEVAIFSRNSTSGALTYVGIVKDGVGDVEGLSSPFSVTVSPDGRFVYVTSGGTSQALVMFVRDPSTGNLIFEDLAADGVGGVAGLADPRMSAVSPDGRNVYVSAASSHAVTTFFVSLTGYFRADLPASEMANMPPVSVPPISKGVASH